MMKNATITTNLMEKTMKKILIAALTVLSMQASANNIDNIKKSLYRAAPKPVINSAVITKTEAAGIYQVVIGSQILYTTADGEFLLTGDLINVETKENITDSVKAKKALAEIAKFDESEMIIYSPKNEKAGVITVWTDPTCPYCKKLHTEIPMLLANNVEVRYLPFPRDSSPTSMPYQTFKEALCYKGNKRLEIIDEAMGFSTGAATADQEERNCAGAITKIEKSLNIARSVGVMGTPALFFSNGKSVPGYLEGKKIIEILNKK